MKQSAPLRAIDDTPQRSLAPHLDRILTGDRGDRINLTDKKMKFAKAVATPPSVCFIAM